MTLRSPIVSLVMIVLTIMAIGLLVLDPTQWLKSLLALGFLPLALLFMRVFSRKLDRADRPRWAQPSVRAAMVGAGALLISAVGFELAEVTGLITNSDEGRSWISVLLVLIVVFGDFLAARMESGADEEKDRDG
ncbi:MAG: hypothetical protein GYB36_07060 [Alphaproteobacteria bacterium]|nr:hypothetical protein [Alphaproteobacteria bacterium]